MKLNGPLITSAVSYPLYFGVRNWMRTLRYRILYHDETVDPVLHPGPPRMFLFWHENILMPLHWRGGCHCAMLLSQHRDADFLARIAGRFGFDCVRGSTQRGGTKALRELTRRAETMHLTITPDGPRGPRRVCSPGPIFLASRTQMPIVAMGFAYQQPWRLGSWDHFAVPRPFTRARAVCSEEIKVPAGLDRDGLETWRVRVERTLNDLTEDAQEWADSGARREGEQRIRGGGSAPPIPVESRRRHAA